MARITLLLILWLGGGLCAAAQDAPRPAEAPPPDFTARQYVDSSGCVFVREGREWRVRLDGAGAAICGYPPTPRKWEEARPLPAGEGPDPAVPMPGMGEIEAQLLTAVAGEMRPGEFMPAQYPPRPAPSAAPEGTAAIRVAGPTGRAAALSDLADPGAINTAGLLTPDVVPKIDGAPDDLGREIAVAIAVQPAIASASAARLYPDQRLCALLGFPAPGADRPARFGVDPTVGYCTGALLALPHYGYRAPGMRDVAASAAGSPTRPDAAPGAGRTAAGLSTRARAPAITAREPLNRAAVAPRRGPHRGNGKPASTVTLTQSVPVRAALPANTGNRIEAMIPAGARWLQIGRPADAATADAVQRRLIAAGFPAARGAASRGRSLVLAGPYGSRRAIVRAYDRLNRAGFAPLTPR